MDSERIDAHADAQAADGLTAEQRRLRNLRVSDAEREHVVELLKSAIGRGLLNIDEFSERADTAYAARTRGELNVVLIDLPGLAHPDAGLGATGPAAWAGNGSSPYQPAGRTEQVELRAHGSNLVRKGRWTVPESLRVRNRFGETKLDFSEAELTSDVVYIELDIKWGSATLIVGEDASVDLNGLHDLKWSSVNDRTRDGRGRPAFVVTGNVHGSSLNVRYPRRGVFAAFS